MSLRLLSRQGCHLCDEAEATLNELGIAHEVVDVDSDKELLRLYDFRVPVILDGDRPLLEGRITSQAVRRALAP